MFVNFLNILNRNGIADHTGFIGYLLELSPLSKQMNGEALHYG